MKNFGNNLLPVLAGLVVLVGIPLWFGQLWLLLSWLPAFFTVKFLKD
jgi:hypothetical protein